MRLNQQQKTTAFIFGILIILAFGALAFITGKPDDSGKIRPPVLSTSTQPDSASSSGWWDSIPTDPSLPIMPGFSTETATASAAPSQSQTSTAFPKVSPLETGSP